MIANQIQKCSVGLARPADWSGGVPRRRAIAMRQSVMTPFRRGTSRSGRSMIWFQFPGMDPPCANTLPRRCSTRGWRTANRTKGSA